MEIYVIGPIPIVVFSTIIGPIPIVVFSAIIGPIPIADPIIGVSLIMIMSMCNV